MFISYSFNCDLLAKSYWLSGHSPKDPNLSQSVGESQPVSALEPWMMPPSLLSTATLSAVQQNKKGNVSLSFACNSATQDAARHKLRCPLHSPDSDDMAGDDKMEFLNHHSSESWLAGKLATVSQPSPVWLSHQIVIQTNCKIQTIACQDVFKSRLNAVAGISPALNNNERCYVPASFSSPPPLPPSITQGLLIS